MSVSIDIEVLKYVLANSGCTTTQLQKALNLNRTTLLYKLNTLQKVHLLKKTLVKNTMVYFPAEQKQINRFFLEQIAQLNQLQNTLTTPTLKAAKNGSVKKPGKQLVLAFVNHYNLLPDYKAELAKYYVIKNYTDTELFLSEDEFVYRAKDADVVVNNWARTIDSALLDRLPNLQYIHASTHMYRYIDIQALKKRNISFSHIQGEDYRLNSLSEYALAQTFALLRKVTVAAAQFRQGVFEFGQFSGELLRGKIAGIIGTDAVSTDLCYTLKGLGTQVLVYNEAKTLLPHRLGLAEFTDLKTLIQRAELLYIVNSEDAPPKVCENLDKTILKLITKPIYLISLTKHKVVDTKLIRKLVYSGLLKGVALDYFGKLPQLKTLEDSDLKDIVYLPNILITPDVGWKTETSIESLNKATTDCLVAYAQGDYSNLLV